MTNTFDVGLGGVQREGERKGGVEGEGAMSPPLPTPHPTPLPH